MTNHQFGLVAVVAAKGGITNSVSVMNIKIIRNKGNNKGKGKLAFVFRGVLRF